MALVVGADLGQDRAGVLAYRVGMSPGCGFSWGISLFWNLSVQRSAGGVVISGQTLSIVLQGAKGDRDG